jgi:hypothetical protein
MNQHTTGNEGQQRLAATETVAGAPPIALPVSRHEVEPTVPYAIVTGPGRDMFLFYHLEASSKDINGLWAYCRFCVSNLVWVNDHFIVTPNPCYLIPSSSLEERFAKIMRVLLNWYSAKRLVASIEWPAEERCAGAPAGA